MTLKELEIERIKLADKKFGPSRHIFRGSENDINHCERCGCLHGNIIHLRYSEDNIFTRDMKSK